MGCFIVYYLLVLIHLLLAEKHAVKGEQAGGAVAQDKLRRDVQPTGKPRVVHARVQRTCRHVEIRVGGQIGTVLRGVLLHDILVAAKLWLFLHTIRAKLTFEVSLAQ